MSSKNENFEKWKGAAFGRTVTFAEWAKGRRKRRELSRKVGGGVVRKKEGSDDRRLRKEFDGERGLPFTPTDELPGTEG